MALHWSQIGTSIDGGLERQNQVTRKMKPILVCFGAITTNSKKAHPAWDCKQTLRVILIFPSQKYSKLSKRLIHPADSFNLNSTALNACETPQQNNLKTS